MPLATSADAEEFSIRSSPAATGMRQNQAGLRACEESLTVAGAAPALPEGAPDFPVSPAEAGT